MNKRLMSLMLSIMLLLSCIPVQADNGLSAPAVLNQEATYFSVTVPSAILITVDQYGEVLTPTNVRILNNSYGPVIVNDVEVETLNSWDLVDFEKDFSKVKVGLKEFGLIINNDEFDGDNLDMNLSNWPIVEGNGGVLPIDYDANVAVQKESINVLDIANLTFIIDWYGEDVDNGEDSSGDEDVDQNTGEYIGDVYVPEGYVLASDNDFELGEYWYLEYIGTDEYIAMPHTIKGEAVTSYQQMFNGKRVKGVASNNPNVTNVKYMFSKLKSQELDLTYFDTSHVKSMEGMFSQSETKTINMKKFDTSNVESMGYMFGKSEATILDLSSFDTSKANVIDMFENCTATVGYARTQEDADILNNTTNKPEGLVFIVR